MDMFSISQLQQFSGVKAHTIRIWEQRYMALKPNRSKGNTRYYDNIQLRRLLNIVSLMEYDYKISELCSLTDSKLVKLIDQHLIAVNIPEGDHEYFISQLIVAATSFEEAYYEKIFSSCVLRLGMKETYTKVIYPMLNRMGLLWATNAISPAYEHFSSNLFKQKLNSAIDVLPPSKSKETWLLYLPENEYHEIGLLFSQYLLRQAGKKVIYLGSSVPLITLKTAVSETKPEHMFFFLVHYDNPTTTQDYLNSLKKKFPKVKMHVSGNEKLISQLKTGKNIHWLRFVEDLQKLILL